MGRKFLIFVIFISLLLYSNTVFASEWSKTSLTNDLIGSMETSIWGVLAGEYDSRLWKNPYNGIYISKDFGDSWEELGLEGRGINDIKYSNHKIYASSYYVINEQVGLFVSEDAGKTWQHLCKNFSSSSVSVYEDTIILGTYSHGLWMSNDGGQTWEQKIGTGHYGPDILETEIYNNIAIATTREAPYISYDSGETWQVSSVPQETIDNALITSNFILMGGPEGLYKSVDSGYSWNKIGDWGNQEVGTIIKYKNSIFAGKFNTENYRYDVFESKDFGETWVPTNLPQLYNWRSPRDMTWVFSNPSYLLASVPYEGIYKYNISENLQNEYAFLEIPWETQNKSSLIDKISSFFDHEYPLLGYTSFSEPLDTQKTTINYLGFEEKKPNLYYSSHDGTDFSLNYGTPILSAYSGYASYEYDSGGLGHYITINHKNGYETTYAHLQNNGLITTGQNYWVEAGQQIGLIGTSGNTTGPHLHFSIKRLNVSEPENRIDPFGWQAPLINDPWETFSWTDTQGYHKGSKSPYLWKFNPKTEALSNKQVIIDRNSHEQNFTVFIEPYTYPKVPITQNKLTYITGTSMLINLYNILGQEIPELLEPARIEVDISNVNTEDLLENTINIYSWNEETSLWEPIPSVYDYITKKVIGETKHFSKFAVFGISEDAWVDKASVLNTEIAL